MCENESRKNLIQSLNILMTPEFSITFSNAHASLHTFFLSTDEIIFYKIILNPKLFLFKNSVFFSLENQDFLFLCLNSANTSLLIMKNHSFI